MSVSKKATFHGRKIVVGNNPQNGMCALQKYSFYYEGLTGMDKLVKVTAVLAFTFIYLIDTYHFTWLWNSFVKRK